MVKISCLHSRVYIKCELAVKIITAALKIVEKLTLTQELNIGQPKKQNQKNGVVRKSLNHEIQVKVRYG